ncbi:alanine/ornithine racemase family PLP-dependent enzyme [Vibrio metschnikovii]|uniref:alanine/ornithine racemase family PLP-dependent enzyme n=1 Tax=Vibrio metschnikovii TaxID=28172 RepID=UPI002FCAD078
MNYPRLEINCTKIIHNTQYLMAELHLKAISVTPVTKASSGHPLLAQLFIHAGATMLADSRVENMQRMRCSGISIPLMLIRTPMLSQIAGVVSDCSISLNTEIEVIQALSDEAQRTNSDHSVIIMVELGDLREGVMAKDLIDFIGRIVLLPNIIIKGIGANLACRYGIAPDEQKMAVLSALADEIECTFDIHLDIISGGNSASLQWALAHTGQTRINHLRIGEAIFFGYESLYQETMAGLQTDAMILTAEVIESNLKPSLPWGKRGNNAFGEQQPIEDRGPVTQAILALGRQDVDVSGLTPPQGITIVSSTSDHLIVETLGEKLRVGQKISFSLNYSGFLSAMSSQHVYKLFSYPHC